MKNRSTISNCYIQDEPFYKEDLGGKKAYLLLEDFEIDRAPLGWTVGTLAGGTVSYTTTTPTGMLGSVRLLTGAPAISRAGLIYSNAAGFIRTSTDALQTIYKQVFEAVTLPANTGFIMGLFNTVTINALQFGNGIGFMYDPTNMSGYNPTLITNLFFICRANYNGAPAQTVIDLGFTPSLTISEYSFVYDNILNQIRVYLDGVLLTTITNLANVPTGSVRGIMAGGTGNSLCPSIQVSNSAAGGGLNIQFDRVFLFKQFTA